MEGLSKILNKEQLASVMSQLNANNGNNTCIPTPKIQEVQSCEKTVEPVKVDNKPVKVDTVLEGNEPVNNNSVKTVQQGIENAIKVKTLAQKQELVDQDPFKGTPVRDYGKEGWRLIDLYPDASTEYETINKLKEGSISFFDANVATLQNLLFEFDPQGSH